MVKSQQCVGLHTDFRLSKVYLCHPTSPFCMEYAMGDIAHLICALRLESPTARLSRVLPPIPSEILQIIARHLDRPSAYNLTTTCRALRDAGEMKLYETVHLSENPDKWDRESVRSRFARYGCHCWGETANYDLRVAQACAEAVSTRCDALAFALDAYPPRAQYIRNLILQPFAGTDDRLAKRMLQILLRLAPTLIRLYVVSIKLEVWTLAMTTPSSRSSRHINQICSAQRASPSFETCT